MVTNYFPHSSPLFELKAKLIVWCIFGCTAVRFVAWFSRRLNLSFRTQCNIICLIRIILSWNFSGGSILSSDANCRTTERSVEEILFFSTHCLLQSSGFSLLSRSHRDIYAYQLVSTSPNLTLLRRLFALRSHSTEKGQLAPLRRPWTKYPHSLWIRSTTLIWS